MKLLSVVGARPNFMKIAPFCAAVATHNAASRGEPVEHVLVHTGQHYDTSLSDRFFEELGIPRPQHSLEVGSGSHAYQAGMTMIRFEPVLLEEDPDWVIVVGDVNATSACALTAKKHGYRVAHIEAGLRSNDWTMPEEVNRVVTDRLSDLLFTTCRFADENLAREGAPPERIARVGNIMIDTLEACRPRAAGRDLGRLLGSRGIAEGAFGVVTLHRPSNVDESSRLAPLIDLIGEFADRVPMVFPVHPRTAARLEEFGLWQAVRSHPRIHVVAPLGYVDMLACLASAALVMTDSGGIQEECCVLGTPCLTLRPNTERPATLAEHGGTNRLVGTDAGRIRRAFEEVVHAGRAPSRPPLWDGHTAPRILERLLA